MADRVTETITIAATVETVREVLLDFDQYPEWARDLKAVQVTERDDEGRAAEVRYRAAGMGRSTSYTLRYDYDDPSRVAWVLTKGDITAKLDGHYQLNPVDLGTQVDYELEVELKVPLPGFIKRRTQGRIMHTALAELKDRVENLAT